MKRLVIFLAVTFGLSWGLWIPAGIVLGTFTNGEASQTLMLVLIALGMFFPLVGALVANRACKPEERIDLGFRPHFGGNMRHYLAAWFMPTLLTFLGCVVYFLVFNDQFSADPETWAASIAASSAAGIEAPEITADQMPLILAATLFSSIAFAPFINMIPALGEEVGWRGMLLPTLAERMPTRAAVVVSGVIWGLWHAPIIAMGHNYGMDYAGFPIAGILVMTLLCTGIGMWLAQLRLQTGSIWPCALAHGAINAIVNFGVMFSTTGMGLFGPSPLGLVAGIPALAWGLICLARIGSGDSPTAR